MKQHIFVFLTIFLLALLAPLLSAADAGGYAGAYLQLSVHPRAAGMGNAFAAVSDDPSGVFFNPAGVASLPKISFGGGYRDMSLQRSLQQAVVLFPVRGEAAIGFSGEMASMGNIIGRDSRGNETGELKNLDAVISLTFARRFSRFVSIGGNARYYYKKLETTNAYSAGFDIGAMVHLDQESALPPDGVLNLLRFGAVVKNISAKFPWNTGNYWPLGTDVSEDVPLAVRLGASALMLKNRVLLAIDAEKDEERSMKLYVGGEVKIVPQLALRAGAAGGEPAFGAGFILPINTRTVQIDVAVEQARNIGGWESIFGFSIGL